MNMVDKRTQLQKGALLNFRGITCKIIETIGKGSNGIAYLGFYEDETSKGLRHDVLIKELFPLDPNGGIIREENGSIIVHPEGQELWDIHSESFSRGNRFHLELLQRHPEAIGANLNTYSLNGTLYTLLGCTGGSTMDRLPLPESGLLGIAERMLGVLDALEVFHEANCLHMDISPDNVLIIPQARREHVLLIDYNSSLNLEEWHTGINHVLSMKDGYTAPEVMNGDADSIGFSTDLYSVVAIFYECLMGETLSLWDMIMTEVPDVHGSKLLQNAPETVMSMIGHILETGLAAIPELRYASVDDMRRDFLELIDRINCVGVTHWAIWEKENERLSRIICRNPALSFLEDAESMFPIRVEYADATYSIEDMLARVLVKQDLPLLLMAQGGMGKTTALMSVALTQNRWYDPCKAVAIYIPVYNCREGEQWFVHDQILSMLQFKPGTQTYSDARHELDQLLSKPLSSAGQHMPSVILLLDGLNEISCDPAPLIRELNELTAMSGVRILVTSRTSPEGLQTRLMSLNPLTQEDISQILSGRGILMPESESVQRMLATPLLLSMYIRSIGEDGVRIETAANLMESMLQKEADRYAEDLPEHWQADMAIHYALPAIAYVQQRKKRSLTETEMVKIITGCYHVMKSRSMVRAFPQWVGHRKAILNGCSHPDEWYGLIVQDLLWRRMGLLLRDEQGTFRVVHQEICEWQAGSYRELRQRIRHRRWIQCAHLTCTTATIGILGWYLLWKPYIAPLLQTKQIVRYDENASYILVRNGLTAYSAAARQADHLLAYLETDYTWEQTAYGNPNDKQDFWYIKTQCKNMLIINMASSYAIDMQEALEAVTADKPDDAVLPLSGVHLDAEGYTAISEFPALYASRTYAYFDKWQGPAAPYEENPDQYDEYTRLLIEAIRSDLAVLNWYFNNVLAKEIEGAQQHYAIVYSQYTGIISGYPKAADLDTSIETLLEKQHNAWKLVDQFEYRW